MRRALLFTILMLPALAWAGQWLEHKSELTSLSVKLAGLEKELGKLIHEKKSTGDPQQQKALNGQIVFTHNEMQTTHKKYKEVYDHMRYRHPEKGEEFEKDYYKVFKLKTIDEIETDIGLDGKLTRLKKKIDHHYGHQSEKKEEASARKWVIPTPTPADLGRIRLVK